MVSILFRFAIRSVRQYQQTIRFYTKMISKSSQYALRAIIYLAYRYGKKERINIKEIAKAIEAVNKSDGSNGFETEIKSFGELFEMADKKEGVAAFLEKRKPSF